MLKPGGCYMLTCSAPPGLHTAGFVLEKQRAPACLKHVLDGVESIEYQRRDYLEAAMVGKVAGIVFESL